MYNSYYHYPRPIIIRAPPQYPYSNTPFLQREVLLVPQRGYYQYFQSPRMNTFIESYKYDQIQTDYLNIPTDEYVIVQTPRINTKRKNEKGEQVKECVQGPTTVFNYKSSYGGIPVSAVYHKIKIDGYKKY